MILLAHQLQTDPPTTKKSPITTPTTRKSLLQLDHQKQQQRQQERQEQAAGERPLPGANARPSARLSRRYEEQQVILVFLHMFWSFHLWIVRVLYPI